MDRNLRKTIQDHEETHWWFVSRRLILEKILTHFLPYTTEWRDILEIGCGSGGNLQMLQAHGNVSAVELDEPSRRKANNREICLVQKGGLPDDIPFDTQFDVICALDVLEHIDNDLLALQSINNHLKENGTLLVTVPAYNFLWSQHDDANQHYRRYTKTQLITIASNSSLQIKYSTYFNTLLFPILATYRIVEKLVSARNTMSISRLSVPLEYLLQSIFSSERFLLPSIAFPFGLSVLLVAHKVTNVETH
jgi:SAM-dependent methyltransferase